jgi:hypothetical protein
MIKRISEKTKNTDDIFPDDEETIIGIMKNAFQDEWETRAGIMVNNKHLFSCVVNDFIIHMRDKDLVYKRKHFKDVVLASEEFSLFLRERMLALEKEPSTLRNFLKRYISYNMRLKLFDLFFLKIFPRETVRGHVWHRIMAKLLNV